MGSNRAIVGSVAVGILKYLRRAFQQQAAQCLSQSLRERGITARLVSLPEGHDPDSFFVAGGDAQQFHHLLQEASR